MEMKEEEVQALLLNGEDMLARCRGEEARQLRDNLEKLKEKAYDTREKADRKRVSSTCFTEISCFSCKCVYLSEISQDFISMIR